MIGERSAVAAPMPWFAPVTIATRPSIPSYRRFCRSPTATGPGHTIPVLQ